MLEHNIKKYNTLYRNVGAIMTRVELLVKLEELREYMGGDKNDTPIKNENIDEAMRFVNEIDEMDIVMPEVFPYSGGIGLQLEWETPKVYLEINFDYPVNSCIYSAYLKIKNKDIETSLSFEHRKDAANFVKFVEIQYALKVKATEKKKETNKEVKYSKNKYDLKFSDLAKLKVLNKKEFKKYSWRNKLIKAWCITLNIVANPKDSYGTYDDDFFFGVYDDGHIETYCTSYGGMCGYKFENFYTDIENIVDAKLHSEILRVINNLIDLGILAKG